MKLVSSVWCLVFGGLVLGACSSTPTYPPPGTDSGQLLVQFRGEPREGVGGPKRETRVLDYGTTRESVEQGRAFERVDYDEIEDVVVIVDAGVPTLSDVPLRPFPTPEFRLDEEGFDRSQYLAVKDRRGPKGRVSIAVHNTLGRDVLVYAVNADDDFFEVTVSKGALGTISLTAAGRYDVYCDADESFHCVLLVADGPYAWIGASDDDAFFNYLPPGSYDVTVFAPRLPAFSKSVTVAAGKRETVTADLTVNDLPKVGE